MKCVDLFCGCGGLSLGFQNAGFEILAAVDNWDKALNVYKDNFNHDVVLQDISNELATTAIIEKYQPDLIMGGPPCQDFSSAGKRDETQGRADLTYNFSNLVCDFKPQFFIMENVERIKKSYILKEIMLQLNLCGYGLTGAILNASYCGVPQSRNRFFLIGELAGNNDAITPIITRNLSHKKMTMRDYFGDSLCIEYYYRHPRNYNRRGIYSIDEPSPTIRGVNRPVPKGYHKHRGDPQNSDLSIVRPLTTIERSYVQTFPKKFKFKGTKTNLEQMIGNAVPVNLANFIAKCITQYIEEKPKSFKQTTLFEINSGFKIPEKVIKPIAL